MQSFRATTYSANDWGIIFDEVAPLLKPYGIDPKESNFLADLLAWAADIKEYVYCRSYNSNGLEGDIAFSFGYDSSESVLNALSKSLNEKFPGINARYIDQNHVYSHYINQNWMPSKTIKLNVSGFRQHILPFIPEFLTLQKENLQKYEFEFLKMNTELNSFFEKYGVSLEETDCFEDLVCFIAKTKVELAKEIFTALPISIPYVLIEIINEYSFAINSTVDPSTIDTTESKYRPSYSTDMKTDIFVKTPYPSAKNIANFFNLIREGASEVEEKEVLLPPNYDNFTKITVANDAIKNPLFFSEATSALTFYSSDKLQKYRLESQLLNESFKSQISGLVSCWYEKKSYFSFLPWIKTVLEPLMDNFIVYLEAVNPKELCYVKQRELIASDFAKFVIPIRNSMNAAKPNLASVHIDPLAGRLDEIEKLLNTKFIGEMETSESSNQSNQLIDKEASIQKSGLL